MCNKNCATEKMRKDIKKLAHCAQLLIRNRQLTKTHPRSHPSDRHAAEAVCAEVCIQPSLANGDCWWNQSAPAVRPRSSTSPLSHNTVTLTNTHWWAQLEQSPRPKIFSVPQNNCVTGVDNAVLCPCYLVAAHFSERLLLCNEFNGDIILWVAWYFWNHLVWKINLHTGTLPNKSSKLLL
jgi:hypothetical protein